MATTSVSAICARFATPSSPPSPSPPSDQPSPKHLHKRPPNSRENSTRQKALKVSILPLPNATVSSPDILSPSSPRSPLFQVPAPSSPIPKRSMDSAGIGHNPGSASRTLQQQQQEQIALMGAALSLSSRFSNDSIRESGSGPIETLRNVFRRRASSGLVASPPAHGSGLPAADEAGRRSMDSRAQDVRPPRRSEDTSRPRRFEEDVRPPRRSEDTSRPPRRSEDTSRPPRRSEDKSPGHRRWFSRDSSPSTPDLSLSLPSPSSPRPAISPPTHYFTLASATAARPTGTLGQGAAVVSTPDAALGALGLREGFTDQEIEWIAKALPQPGHGRTASDGLPPGARHGRTESDGAVSPSPRKLRKELPAVPRASMPSSPLPTRTPPTPPQHLAVVERSMAMRRAPTPPPPRHVPTPPPPMPLPAVPFTSSPTPTPATTPPSRHPPHLRHPYATPGSGSSLDEIVPARNATSVDRPSPPRFLHSHDEIVPVPVRSATPVDRPPRRNPMHSPDEIVPARSGAGTPVDRPSRRTPLHSPDEVMPARSGAGTPVDRPPRRTPVQSPDEIMPARSATPVDRPARRAPTPLRLAASATVPPVPISQLRRRPPVGRSKSHGRTPSNSGGVGGSTTSASHSVTSSPRLGAVTSTASSFTSSPRRKSLSEFDFGSDGAESPQGSLSFEELSPSVYNDMHTKGPRSAPFALSDTDRESEDPLSASSGFPFPCPQTPSTPASAAPFRAFVIQAPSTRGGWEQWEREGRLVGINVGGVRMVTGFETFDDGKGGLWGEWLRNVVDSGGFDVDARKSDIANLASTLSIYGSPSPLAPFSPPPVPAIPSEHAAPPTVPSISVHRTSTANSTSSLFNRAFSLGGRRSPLLGETTPIDDRAVPTDVDDADDEDVDVTKRLKAYSIRRSRSKLRAAAKAASKELSPLPEGGDSPTPLPASPVIPPTHVAQQPQRPRIVHHSTDDEGHRASFHRTPSPFPETHPLSVRKRAPSRMQESGDEDWTFSDRKASVATITSMQTRDGGNAAMRDSFDRVLRPYFDALQRGESPTESEPSRRSETIFSPVEDCSTFEIFLDRHFSAYPTVLHYLRTGSLPQTHTMGRHAAAARLLLMSPETLFHFLTVLSEVREEATWLQIDGLVRAVDDEMARAVAAVEGAHRGQAVSLRSRVPSVGPPQQKADPRRRSGSTPAPREGIRKAREGWL